MKTPPWQIVKAMKLLQEHDEEALVPFWKSIMVQGQKRIDLWLVINRPDLAAPAGCRQARFVRLITTLLREQEGSSHEQKVEGMHPHRVRLDRY